MTVLPCVFFLSQNSNLIFFSRFKPRFKLGGIVHHWKRRWILMTDRSISYSANDATQDIHETIPLGQISCVQEETGASGSPFRENSFYVITPERRFAFSADSRSEMVEWMQLIDECRGVSFRSRTCVNCTCFALLDSLLAFAPTIGLVFYFVLTVSCFPFCF